MIRPIATIAATMVLGFPLATLAALEPAQQCEASKNKTAGAYFSCRQKAEATAIRKATTPDYSKCSAKFIGNWDSAETDGAGSCPDDTLSAPMDSFLAGQAAWTAAIVAGIEEVPVCGDSLADDGEACDGADLNGRTCASETPSTPYGTLSCEACTSISTAACVARFVDNGDGTITDNQNGRMWEKKTGALSNEPDYSNANDMSNYYTWTSGSTAPDGTLFTDFLDKMNGQAGGGTGFAGYYDWRLPTIEELQSIVDLNAAGCGEGFSGCVYAVFGPTAPSTYHSSSTYAPYPPFDRFVYFGDGGTYAGYKTDAAYARAVRAVP